MTAPIPINLTGFAGATLVVNLTCTRTSSTGVITPVNLAGAILWMTVKTQYSDPDPGVAQVTSTVSNTYGGIIVTDATNGLATATFYDTTFASVIGPVDFYYDVKVIEANGTESIPIFGRLTIKAAVTRAL